MPILPPLVVLVLLAACGTAGPPVAPASPEAAAAAARFAAAHRFAGRTANAAARELREQGFSCFIESREKAGRLGLRSRVPQLWCSKWNGAANAACREERVALAIDWHDPEAEGDALLRQLLTRLVTAQRYTCVPPRD